MEPEVSKGDLLYNTNGCRVYATNDTDLAVVEWDDEGVCQLSNQLHTILREHAMSTNWVSRFGKQAIITRRIEPFPIQVRAHGANNDASVTFHDAQGSVLEPDALKEAVGGSPKRVAVMEDMALHAVRSLRARFSPLDIHEVSLQLTFGSGPAGECQLQVINPLECQLGSTDHADLCHRLGGP